MRALLAALLLLVTIPVAAAAAGTLVAQEESNTRWYIAGPLELAQTFMASAPVRVREIQVKVNRDPEVLTPLTVQLVEGIWPSGVVRRTASVPIDAVPTTEDWVTVRFASGLRLIAGHHYSIVLSSPLQNDEYLYAWAGATGVRQHNSLYELGFATRSDRYPEQFMSLGDFDFAFRVDAR